MPRRTPSEEPARLPVSLKTIAQHLGLSAATVSFVLTNAPNRSIPEITRERVRAAALQFGYQPSLIARSLQGKRTRTIGVLLPELGEGYHSQVLSGAADVFMREGYFFFTTHHRRREDLIASYPGLLHARGAEGLLVIDSHLHTLPPLPTVVIAGHAPFRGVSNIVINHRQAAELALGHLYSLGHREIAYMRGQLFTSDSRNRWRATLHVARALGLEVAPRHVVRLNLETQSPELGYPAVRDLLRRVRDFTAILCFNDIAAIGAIRALYEAGLRVPADVSVVGFDDIHAAAFYTPSLTTIRQPMQQMGSIAAEQLLRRIAGGHAPVITQVSPELIVRESTGPAPSLSTALTPEGSSSAS